MRKDVEDHLAFKPSSLSDIYPFNLQEVQDIGQTFQGYKLPSTDVLLTLKPSKFNVKITLGKTRFAYLDIEIHNFKKDITFGCNAVHYFSKGSVVERARYAAGIDSTHGIV